MRKIKSAKHILTALIVLTTTYASPMIATTATTITDNKTTELKVTEKMTPLIPRATLFGNPERVSVQLSPNGQKLSYIAPFEGILNLWVGDAKDPKSMRPFTHNKKREVAGYHWAYTNNDIIYVDDNAGDENWNVYSVDVNTGKKIVLASFKNVQAKVLALSQKYPEELLIQLNQRRPDLHDVYRLNIKTGKMTPEYENNKFQSFVSDDNLNLRIGFETTEDGGAKIYQFTKNDKGYTAKELFKIEQKDRFTTSPIGINKKGDTFYMIDSRGKNTANLVSLDLNSGKITALGEDKKADIEDVTLHPIEKNVQAYSSNYERKNWKAIDKSIEADLQYLTQLNLGDLNIVTRTLDDKAWVLAFIKDNSPPHYYFYDRPAKKAQFLFSVRPKLDPLKLSNMDPVIIKSRDNLSLISYLSIPVENRIGKAKTNQPLPLILLIHGGPSSRDEWSYNPIHQWLTNRGYAVLSVNYRGSTGFGKEFANAGNGEWSGKMHDDLIDAVQWAVNQGITTSDKVCIMGGSYGGYATLVGLTKTPDIFACGVDIVGPSNLETLMKSIPAYWKPFYSLLKIMIGGDPETEAGRQFLASRSPLTFVSNIKKPLLIGQGANDPRVKQAEADQIVKAMQEKNIPVTYLLYPDEGHGFARPENRLSFYAVTEAFLAKYLGGRFEPIKDDFKNSSVEIKVGKENLPGLNITMP